MVCNGSVVVWFGNNLQTFCLRTGVRRQKKKFREVLNVSYCQNENRFYYFYVQNESTPMRLLRAIVHPFKKRIIDVKVGTDLPALPTIFEE